MSASWSHQIGTSVFSASIQHSHQDKNTNRPEVIKLMQGVRSALSSSLGPLFDLPWTPLLLLFLTGLHPIYGVICLSVISLLVLLSLVNYRFKQATSHTNVAFDSIHDTDSIRAHGLINTIAEKSRLQDEHGYQKVTSALSKTTNILSYTKFFRALAQIAIVAIGASLVVERELTAGAMIAATMLASRVFAPYESMVTSLNAWLSALKYWRQLSKITDISKSLPADATLPDANGQLTAENVMLLYPNSSSPFLSRINLNIAAGQCIAIVGESGCGKSTLLKALAGLIHPNLGQVRLDGASYQQWYSENQSDVLGYYSSQSKFLSGTVMENLSGFKINHDPNKAYIACQKLGIHERILKWPKGYETDLDKDLVPSTSEYHKLLLARAIYESPKLLILDQPDAFLGPNGEKLLQALILQRKRDGLTTLFATSHSSLLGLSDHIVLLEDGTIKSNTPTKKLAQAQSIHMKKASNHG
ncbi:ATP-binding cassette domain-containing protein [Vibrio paucivorans]